MLANEYHPSLQEGSVCTQIAQAMYLHRCESQVYSPAQFAKRHSLYYEAIRQKWQVKRRCDHRVVNCTDAPYSNLDLQAFSQHFFALSPS